MNKKRLLKLADLLETDANNKNGIKFDLAVIAAPARNESGHFGRFDQGRAVEMNCGTAACAVGLACISGEFEKSGLSYRIKDSGAFVPVFRTREGKTYRDFWSAEMKFFGLNEPQNEFLFCAWQYPKGKTKGAIGERYVAKRIRDFVAGKVAP